MTNDVITRPRDRTRIALIEAAAAAFAENGPGCRLSDVADRAGVGEATLYRHFTNRHTLLTAMYEYSIAEAFVAIESADLRNASVEEGVARIARAFVGLHSKFAVLVGMADQFHDAQVGQRLAEPLHDLLRRGMRDGTVSTEFTEAELTHMFRGLIQAASTLEVSGQLPRERAAMLASGTFLAGILSSH